MDEQRMVHSDVDEGPRKYHRPPLRFAAVLAHLTVLNRCVHTLFAHDELSIDFFSASIPIPAILNCAVHDEHIVMARHWCNHSILLPLPFFLFSFISQHGSVFLFPFVFCSFVSVAAKVALIAASDIISLIVSVLGIRESWSIGRAAELPRADFLPFCCLLTTAGVHVLTTGPNTKWSDDGLAPQGAVLLRCSAVAAPTSVPSPPSRRSLRFTSSPRFTSLFSSTTTARGRPTERCLLAILQ